MKTRMSDEEKRIWAAAYAAEYVREFNYARTYREEHPKPGESAFDFAVEGTTAETPATVADGAVLALRRWRSQEDPDCGLKVED